MSRVSMYIILGENVQNRKMKRNMRGKRKEKRKEEGREGGSKSTWQRIL